MQPTNIHRFLMDIQTLEIKVIKDEGSGKDIMSLSHHVQQIDAAGQTLPMSEVRELATIDLLLLPKEQVQSVINRLDIIRLKCNTLIRNCETIFYDLNEEEVLLFLVKRLPNYFITGKSIAELSQYQDIERYSSAVKLFADLISIVAHKIKQINRILGSISTASSVKPIRYIENTSTQSRASTQKTDSSFASYEWIGNKDIQMLFDLLNGHYITNIAFDQFEAVFSAQRIDSIKPLEWNGNATELIYFIWLMIGEKLIVGNQKQMSWKKLTACFVKQGGQAFDEVFKDIKKDMEANIGPTARDRIDAIVKKVK